MRTIAIVPAYNEARTIGGVIDEMRAVRRRRSTCSSSPTARPTERPKSRVRTARTCSGSRSTSASAAPYRPGFRYAWENGYELAVRCDGDGQHDPAELAQLLPPVLTDNADICVGSRFAGGDGYRSSRTRRIGIRLLAGAVSLLAGQRLTDTTCGFQALNRRAIGLFAADYPHDYPEVEGMVMLMRHGLRLAEVPVAMREREHGTRRSRRSARSTTW